MAKIRKLWGNEYFKTLIMILLMIAIVFGFWYGLQLILNTSYPALAVASGSMCKAQYMRCDGWSHPFEQTLHVGDLIIVQGVNPKEIKAAPYPDGDIIVFRRPGSGPSGDLIVHRAVGSETINGVIYFTTQGDGSSSKDPWKVSEDLIIGKVVLRIPWVGHVALLLHNSFGISIIIILFIILVVLEFIFPIFSKEGNGKTKRETTVEGPSEPKDL
ncbi:MAG: signal peptidase I [Candidatus Bathyarchaeia archaeon]